MPKRVEDITGNSYNGILVLRNAGRPHCNTYWVCRCHCGKEFETTGRRLVEGRAKSCGCRKGYFVSAARTSHGECKAPEYMLDQKSRKHYHTRLYKIWDSMISRCYYGNHRYKQLGITVCDEWRHNFIAFRDWALSNGYADDLSIDRIDGEGRYEPSNCRWITALDQQNNIKTNVWYEFGGRSLTLAQWARESGIGYSTFCSRWRRGERGNTLLRGVTRP